MQQHHAVIIQQFCSLGEVFAVMRRPDMFEHADGNNAVIRPRGRHVAIVLQLETHLGIQTALLRTVARNPQLLFAERDARDLDAGAFGKIHGHPTPTGPDFQHAMACLRHKLCRDMSLLGNLRFVETDAGRVEVGAGVLPVLVQKQIEQLGAQIVMVGNVVLVMIDRQMHLDTGRDNAGHAAPDHAECQRFADRVAFDEGEKIIDVALNDNHPPFHEHFRQLQRGVCGNLVHRGLIGEVDGDTFSSVVAKDLKAPGPVTTRFPVFMILPSRACRDEAIPPTK